jgi:hypothetical protein
MQDESEKLRVGYGCLLDKEIFNSDEIVPFLFGNNGLEFASGNVHKLIGPRLLHEPDGQSHDSA